jgi:hypothetical protein
MPFLRKTLQRISALVSPAHNPWTCNCCTGYIKSISSEELSNEKVDVMSAETNTCEEFCAKIIHYIHDHSIDSRTQERIRKREIKQRGRTHLTFPCRIA